MGQVLGRVPGLKGLEPKSAPENDVDKGGEKPQYTPSKGVHRIALHEDEEIVIRDNHVLLAVNGEELEDEAPPEVEVSVNFVSEVGSQARTLRSKRHIDDTLHTEAAATPLSLEYAILPQSKRRAVAEPDQVDTTAFQPTLIKSRERYPFLDDAETADYLATSRVVFVLRGVPGSGKSYLAQKIRGTFKDAVIYSADDFFMKDGRYEYDRALLREAHESCAALVTSACQGGARHIVVDNTHIRDWEWRGWTALASRHQYLLLLVEPDTAWKRDPAVLARRNTHAVSEADIRKKLKGLRTAIPLYYGWYLNAADCALLSQKTQMILEKLAEKYAPFAEDFSVVTDGGAIGELFALYQQPRDLLHCTARFCARGKVPGSWHYAESAAVAGALGVRSVLRVAGLLLTPRTLGARVTLTDEQLQVWGQPDYEPTPVKAGGRQRHGGSRRSRKQKSAEGEEAAADDAATTESLTQNGSSGKSCDSGDLASSNSHDNSHHHSAHYHHSGAGHHHHSGPDLSAGGAGHYHHSGAGHHHHSGAGHHHHSGAGHHHHSGPDLSAGGAGQHGWLTAGCEPSLAVSGGQKPVRTTLGRRAHVTLGFRPGQRPVVAGDDLMAALDVMEAQPEIMRAPLVEVGRARLHRVEDHVWYVRLERDMVVDVVFAGRY